MRQYEILSGKNKGTYIIYDDIREARRELGNPKLEVESWREGKTGDWVLTDDGRVVKIINIYNLSNYGGKDKPRFIDSKTTGRWIGSKAVKVCFGVYTVYGKKNGDIVSNKMIAEPYRMEEFRKNRVSITAHATILGKFLTKRKKMFVYYYQLTGNPILALKQVIPKNAPYLTKKHTFYKAIELLKDKYVIKELNTYMKTEESKISFRKKLLNSLEQENLNIEDFAQELKVGLEQTKKGSMAHRQWVEMYGKILTYSHEEGNELIPDKLSQKNVQEITYQDNQLLPPPTSPSQDL